MLLEEVERLLWVDLETTGLDPFSDLLLEVGFVVTTCTPQLDMLAAKSVVVRRGADTRRMAKSAVRRMHDESGLWAECASVDAPDFFDAEKIAVGWLKRVLRGAVLGPLCGSSVHFDRLFLMVDMPRVLEWATYRNLDVSSLLMAAEMEGRVPPAELTKGADHRALPDLHRSINLARWAMRGQR